MDETTLESIEYELRKLNLKFLDTLANDVELIKTLSKMLPFQTYLLDEIDNNCSYVKL